MHDSHVHSIFSDDGMEAVEDVVATALSRGCDYVAITGHVNRDYQVIGYDNPQINMSAYVAAMQDFKRRFNKKNFRLAMGAELGYLKSANNLYIKDLADIDFDVIINSVHCVLGSEVYYAEYFNKCPYKHFAYLEYLKAVRESVDAPYPYDIIGHIGYIQRNAPYKEPDMFYEEFSDVFDDILTAIIEKDKCLEVNSKTYRGGKTTSEFSLRHLSIPDVDVLKRYYELGGRKISFGSDAHRTNSIAYNYDKIAAAMKEIGFEGFTRYVNREPELVKF